MINLFRAENKMKRLYRPPHESNSYEYRFLEDLSTGYSFYLRDEKTQQDFFTIEPKGCNLFQLIEKSYMYDFSDDFEKIIENITYDLVVYGRAYAFLHPLKNQGASMELESIEIYGLKGFIQKKDKSQVIFYVKRGDENAEKKIIPRNQLIEFDLKDMGYKRHYFRSIIKKLGKCDYTAELLKMPINNPGYDYLAHKEKSKICELRILRDIGWFMSIDGLSDSYIFHKRMQFNKLRIRFLTYILGKINNALKSMEYVCDSEIVAHIKSIDYDELWQEYSDGKITGSKLNSILSVCH